MDFTTFNFVLHALVTFAMTGIIWFVEFIHYPVIHSLNQENKQDFENIHWNKTMKLAVPMLSIELISGILFIFFPPENIPLFIPIIGCILLIPIWVATWGFCVPSHCELKNHYSRKYLTRLLGANRLRAIFWSIRSILIFGVLIYIIR